jgi:hypothetical protein
MKSILDPSFRYTNSVETDLRKTFAKAHRKLRKQQQADVGVNVEGIKNVLSLRPKKAAL